MNYLADKGYEPVYGARPLKRLIQQEVETNISRMIIKGEVLPRETVVLSEKDDKLHLDKER